MQNKTIRVSDLNKTNDFMEKKWTTKFINVVLKEQLEEHGIKMNLLEDYWYDEGINNHLQYFNREVKRVLYDNTPMLITCFSEEKDKLSQWRAYGQDGMGVAIGFNYKKIKQLEKGFKHLSVEKVIYNEKKQKERIGELISSVILYMEDMFNKDSVKVSNDFNVYFTEEFDAFCEVFVDYIDRVSCIIKNPAFSEEKEVRIIYDPKLTNPEVMGEISLSEADDFFSNIKESKNYKLNPMKFNVRNDQLVSFCDIDFGKLIKEQIINEIVIGPKSKLTEKDLYYFLLSNGYDANNIIRSYSEATYR
jgi:hypothetical protein